MTYKNKRNICKQYNRECIDNAINALTRQEIIDNCKCLTHHFRSRAKYTEFAETDMKGRARESAVRLFDNDDVDRTGEGRGIYLVVEETEVADDLGDIVHTVHVLNPRH